jgi:hypothetical protein
MTKNILSYTRIHVVINTVSYFWAAVMQEYEVLTNLSADVAQSV